MLQYQRNILVGVRCFSSTAFKNRVKRSTHCSNGQYSRIIAGFFTLVRVSWMCKRVSHRCELLYNAVPTAHKVRLMPFAPHEEIAQEINTLLDERIIEKIGTADWMSPIALTKRNNGKICHCVDLRSVNKNIVQMRYPLPNIETWLASVKDADYVTK